MTGREMTPLQLEKYNERIKLYEQGKPDQEIANLLHYTKETICSWRKLYGLKPNRAPRKKHNVLLEEERYRLYNLEHNDVSIAREIGVEPHAIYIWRKKNNLPANYKGRWAK